MSKREIERIKQLEARIRELEEELALEHSRRAVSESYELLYARELVGRLLADGAGDE